MTLQHLAEAHPGVIWDDKHTNQAIESARYHANRWARRGGRARADRDDLCQDILLEILERSARYDGQQAAWSTFVAVLARHVVADRMIADRRERCIRLVLVDIDLLEAGAVLTSATQPEPGDDATDVARRIDLGALIDDLPAGPRATLLLLLAADGDIAAAQRASGRSPSACYRSVDDLRLWLRAAGLGFPPTPPGKIARLDR